MQAAWNARAEADAVFYVESHHATDEAGFYARGEERAAVFLDPVLSLPGRRIARGHVLEIGCGLGRFSRALARRFEAVTAVDVSDVMVARARAANTAFPNIAFRATDGETLPVPDGSVDFAFSYEVFQHMPSHAVIRANLRELGRVLRRGGLAMIHLRTGDLPLRLVYRAANAAPDSVHAVIKRLRGRRPLTSDATWRGAPPLSGAQIAQMSGEAGLRLVETLPDPTHEAGTRVFAVLAPAKA
jgi:SAM-dependent methyltransferase